MSLKTASKQLASTKTFAGSLTGGGGGGVTITSITVTDNSWNNLDDTAIGTTGGYIKINGTGFVTNPKVFVGSTEITSGNITFISSSLLRVVVPSLSLGTYNIFVFNTDNSGAILTPGLVVSGTPDFTQTVYTTSTPLSVSVQLLATGDAPLTYELQAGSSLPAGCSLSSSGLITGTTVDGVYQFTVIVSDAQLQSFQQQITLTITSADANFKSTVLAINADTDTFVRDASSNSFAVTINGDTRPSAFSPYNTNWSNLFDGNGDLLNFTKQTTTSSFTCECWFWRGDNVSGYHCVFGGSNTSNQNPDNVQLVVSNTGAVALTLAGLATIGQTGTAVIQYQWNHIAWVRSGTSCAIFVNGQRIATGTSSAALNVDRIASIGGQTAGTYDARGYISNARITTSAVYDPAQTSITIPVSPLTNIANTYILTCQSNRLIDNSTNNLAITKYGDVKVTAFGPFTETDTTTGSSYFDGTGDNLQVVNNAAFQFGSENFTIEFFAYFNSVAVGHTPLSMWSSSQYQFSLYTSAIGVLSYYLSSNGTTWNIASGVSCGSISAGQWIHVALVRNGSTFTPYLNGVAGTTTTSASALHNSTAFVTIGSGNGVDYFNGHISNVRIIKGTAVYTSAFTPPTAALTAIANTSLLTLQTRIAVNNHTFVDHSGINNLITRTGNASQGSFSPFSPAGWSNYFDGNDTLNLADSALFTFPGAFTVESWIFWPGTSTSMTYQCVYGGHDGTSGTWGMYIKESNSYLSFFVNGSLVETTAAVPKNSWVHIAATRDDSNVVRVFINGTNGTSSPTVAGSIETAAGGLNIGRDLNTNGYYLGYVSNLRILKGTALYTTNFTPSTAALTAIANTSLLTCQSNRFKDNSTNNFTLTVNGDARVVNFSPFAPNASYSPAIHGGSVYFDGTGDYLTVASNPAFTLGSSGNFTIECWVYLTASPSNYAPLLTTWTNSTNSYANRWAITYYGNRLAWFTDAGNIGVTDSVAPTLNEWTHIAAVRSGSTITLYKNGVSLGTQTTAQAYTTDGAVSIGFITGVTAITGYITSARIVKGTAVYTSNFTPPTAPVTAIANTSLLLNYTNAGIVDVTSRNVLESVGDTKIRTDVKKYGNGSMYFDGTGDYLKIPTTLNFAFNTGNFTIEFWAWKSANGVNGFDGVIGVTNNTASNPVWFVELSSSRGFRIYVDGNVCANTTTTGINDSTWHHWAICRSGSTWYLFKDGVALTKNTDNIGSTSIVTGSNIDIGRAIDINTSFTFNGYIDDLRITNGVARYTANFTPPTSTFLTQ